jgi:hypothetical protein
MKNLNYREAVWVSLGNFASQIILCLTEIWSMLVYLNSMIAPFYYKINHVFLVVHIPRSSCSILISRQCSDFDGHPSFPEFRG